MAHKTPHKGWIDGGIGYIPLTRGLIAIVDPAMVSDLEQHNWYAGKGGNRLGGYYAYRRVKGSVGRVAMHRYVFGMTDSSLVVDHINHNTLDNRRSNLRQATAAQNSQNVPMRSSNSTGYKGVSWDKTNHTYLVHIRHNGKQIHLGRRKSLEEAHALYCEGANRLHGEFACVK